MLMAAVSGSVDGAEYCSWHRYSIPDAGDRSFSWSGRMSTIVITERPDARDAIALIIGREHSVARAAPFGLSEIPRARWAHSYKRTLLQHLTALQTRS